MTRRQWQWMWAAILVVWALALAVWLGVLLGR